MGNTCTCDGEEKWDIEHKVEKQQTVQNNNLQKQVQYMANNKQLEDEDDEPKFEEQQYLKKMTSLRDRHGNKNLKDVLNES